MTIKIIRKIKFGNAYGVVAEITGPSSYDTGGHALTARQFGLNVIENIVTQGQASAYDFSFDFANGKMQMFNTNNGTEATSKADLDAIKVRVTVFGY